MRVLGANNLNFGYALSKEVEQVLEESTGLSIEQMREGSILQKIPQDKFYQAPSSLDLPPRNILLSENKILKIDEVKRYLRVMPVRDKINKINNIIDEVLFYKPVEMFRKLGKIFRKNK